MTLTVDSACDDRVTQCPICLDEFDWRPQTKTLYRYRDDQGYEAVEPSGISSRAQLEGLRRVGYIRCPNASDDQPAHFLPLLYTAYHRPIVIALVGASCSGKTHLLAAMIGEIERGGLEAYGLKADALDLGRHRHFLGSYVSPLLVDGMRLEATSEGVADFVDALLISSGPTDTWPVAFYDVAGEDLSRLARNTQFLNAVSALMFVADPGTCGAVPLARDDGHDDLVAGVRRAGDVDIQLGEQSFRSVLAMLHPAGGYLDTPAAIVVNKSDRLRFVPPADRWLRRRDNGTVDPALLLEESRDAYAWLTSRGAGALLQPYHYCRRCTLHFASATGGEVRYDRYPRGAHPIRVLEPLVSVLAMCGVLGADLARRVGT